MSYSNNREYQEFLCSEFAGDDKCPVTGQLTLCNIDDCKRNSKLIEVNGESKQVCELMATLKDY